MKVNAAFLGLYCDALRAILPCLTGPETKVFLALALHNDVQGKGFPGVRVLSDLTGFPTEAVGELLDQLAARDVVLCLRKAQRDPFTGRIIPDVWIVNPEIVVISDPSLWNEFRVRHASMPDSAFPVKSAQAESDSQKQSHRSISSEAESQAPDGAASLRKTNTPTNAGTSGSASSSHALTRPSAAGRPPPNSVPQYRTSPGSAAPPPRILTFQESIQVNAIRQHVPDMSAATAIKLVNTYGLDRLNMAVVLCEQRDKSAPIRRKTGWITTYLKSTNGARK